MLDALQLGLVGRLPLLDHFAEFQLPYELVLGLSEVVVVVKRVSHLYFPQLVD